MFFWGMGGTAGAHVINIMFICRHNFAAQILCPSASAEKRRKRLE